MPEIIYSGPEGRLEGRVNVVEGKRSPVAMILHPLPQFGGNMNNPIVYNLYQTFIKKGFSVLRFNFRGVGKSQGDFDHGIGELSDAAASLDWVQSQVSDSKGCWVAGYSFGAWIAMQLLMRRPEINRFVAISPQPNVYDFSFLSPCPTSGLMIYGNKDELVPLEYIMELGKRLSAQKGIKVEFESVPDANHFFSKVDQGIEKSLNKYIKKESALY